jgi:dTDP-glucose pyrophosphorylase
LKVILPMAGAGSRFRKAGFEKPKYELKANGKHLFDWALLSLREFFHDSEFIFICPNGADSFIKERCHDLGIQNYYIETVEAVTRGQAETVLKALNFSDESILIYNIDTHLNIKDDFFSQVNFNVDGWLLLFKAFGSHWSFAKFNEEGRVVDVAEKVRISDYASAGLYYFRSSDQFIDIISNYDNDIIDEYNELYVAPMYNYILKNDEAYIGQSVINFSSVIPLGTPEEVVSFDKDFSPNHC